MVSCDGVMAREKQFHAVEPKRRNDHAVIFIQKESWFWPLPDGLSRFILFWIF